MGQKINKCCRLIIPLAILGFFLSACGGGTLTPTPIPPTPVSPTSIPSTMTPWPTWTPIVTIPCDALALKQAIQTANSTPGTLDTLDLTPNCLYQFTVGSGYGAGFYVLSSIVINGNGATIQAAGFFVTDRVFFVSNNGNLSLNDLTISGGYATGPYFVPDDVRGGGILNNNYLRLNRVVIDGNHAVEGGGIYNKGTLVILNSTFKDNQAHYSSDVGTVRGGAIVNLGGMTISNSTFMNNDSAGTGGAIENVGVMTIRNSTISGNSANGVGTAIYNSGNLTMAYSTIMDNTGMGALHSDYSSISIKNSIIANNHQGDCSYPLSSTIQEENLHSDGSCFGFSIDTHAPGLGTLANNGGQTFTHSLILTSPAVDAATGYCPPTDQRGVTRPEGSACDLGAYELIGGGPTPEPTEIPSSVEGFIFNDGNGNGIRDVNEVSAGVTGAHISLMEGTCPGTNLLTETWSISPDGLYAFGMLNPGTYCILPDLTQQTLLPGSQEITVSDDDHLVDVNFYVPDPGLGQPSQNSNRCDLFNEIDMSLVMLNLPADTMVLPLYVRMEGGVPGLAVDYPEYLEPWEYTARLGNVESYICSLQGGFEDRLYCLISVPSNLPGTAPEFFLRLNGCELPIYNHPGLIIPEPQGSGSPSSSCTANLGESACAAAGGTFVNKDTPQQTCQCP